MLVVFQLYNLIRDYFCSVANVTFMVMDGMSGFVSVNGDGDGGSNTVTSVATTSIRIQHVNQPPQVENTSATVVSGLVTLLTLTGTDVDGDDSELVSTVISLPLYGSLYDGYDDGHDDVESSPITHVPYALPHGTTTLYYKHDSSLPLYIVSADSGIVGKDSFGFTFTDAYDFESVVAAVQLYVTSSIIATAGASITAPENTLISIQVCNTSIHT